MFKLASTSSISFCTRSEVTQTSAMVVVNTGRVSASGGQ